MHYQLLGASLPRSPLNYRGVERDEPRFQPALPEEAPVNRAFLECCAYGHELPSGEVACRLAEELARGGLTYEVVQLEVMDAPALDDLPGQLGFDVCQHCRHSLLSWGLHWDTPPPPPLGPLLLLIEAHFRPLLNENGLFGRWEDARLFLDVVDAISAVAPGTWEAPGYDRFDIVRLVRIVCAETHAEAA